MHGKGIDMAIPRSPFVMIAAALVALAGCGDSGPFEYMPVSGTLTYEDGAPIPAGGVRLAFKPQDVQPVDGNYPRPAMADVDEQGNFARATTIKYGDGLVPGKHQVAVYYATDKDGNLLVPQEYTHFGTTPLVVDTGDDGVIEIKVPRP
jgi:hypothetical protein